MSLVNLGGLNVSRASYERAREIVNNKPKGTGKSTDDVLNSLRKMMPGWTITTDSANWSEGFRNIEIDENTLRKMAENPEEMVRFKALILDLEDTVPALEEWASQNTGKSIEFGITLDLSGNATATAVVRKLLGGEIRTTFNLPSDKNTWADLLRQKLEALNEGKVEDAEGNRSWLV